MSQKQEQQQQAARLVEIFHPSFENDSATVPHSLLYKPQSADYPGYNLPSSYHHHSANSCSQSISNSNSNSRLARATSLKESGNSPFLAQSFNGYKAPPSPYNQYRFTQPLPATSSSSSSSFGNNNLTYSYSARGGQIPSGSNYSSQAARGIQVPQSSGSGLYYTTTNTINNNNNNSNSTQLQQSSSYYQNLNNHGQYIASSSSSSPAPFHNGYSYPLTPISPPQTQATPSPQPFYVASDPHHNPNNLSSVYAARTTSVPTATATNTTTTTRALSFLAASGSGSGSGSGFGKFPDFQGKCIKKPPSQDGSSSDHEVYKNAHQQYANLYNSQKNQQMRPDFIVYVKNDDDIRKAITYANSRRVAIAIRTGGHQYSGASSTVSPNFQIDMTDYDYFNVNDQNTRHLDWNEFEKEGTVCVRINLGLKEFNQALADKKLFIPHGQCSTVHIGGHLQSGGYGQLARAFGLFCDHIVGFRIFLATEQLPIYVTKESNAELFFAVLGGSPGNFGVITHVRIRPLKDSDHPNSRGLKAVYFYNKDHLKRLLDVVVEMESMPRDFDFGVTVMSNWFDLLEVFPGLSSLLEEASEEATSSILGKLHLNFLNNILGSKSNRDKPDIHFGNPEVIIVLAQWSNTGGANQTPDGNVEEFFKRILETSPSALPPLISSFKPDSHTPMSKIAKESILLPYSREFPLPYEKRCHVTDWTAEKLQERKWSEVVSDRIDKIIGEEGFVGSKRGLKVISQLQNFGGVESQIRQNWNNGTCHSWREVMTVCFTLDAFYKSSKGDKNKYQQEAYKYCENNRKLLVGDVETRCFCDRDLRLLWGSYSDSYAGDNLSEQKVWQCYFNETDHNRILQTKKKIDTYRVFTANSFSVGY